MKGSRDCFSGQSWSPDHSWKSCGSMWRHQIQGLMGVGCPAVLRALCAHQWDTDYVNSYKNEYVCVCACTCVHTHTHTSSTVCLWSGSRASALSLFFLPSILGQPIFLQTDKALLKVQCTRLLLHCHQKPLMKCLISLWGYLYLVDLPDNTFGSRTWNFLFACSCYIKSVVGHTIIFIENLRIPALGDDSDRCFQTVTSLEHN